MLDRVDALRAVVGAYEDQRALTSSRLEHDVAHRNQLELARELLVEHGETAGANQLQVEIQDLNQHISASKQLIVKIDGMLATYRASLDRISRRGAG